MKHGVFAIIACLMLAIGPSAAAQESGVPAPQPAEPSPETGEPEPSTDTEEPAEEVGPYELRDNTLGAGPAVIWWPVGSRPFADPMWGVNIQIRNVRMFGKSVIGVESTFDLVLHDFEFLANTFDWYRRAAQEQEDEDIVFLKYFFGWPLLILMPFAATNYHAGLGFIVYTGTQVPAMWFDWGVEGSLFLRPSDRFLLDFGVGLYTGIGFDIARWFGISSRVHWGLPLFHAIFHDTAGIVTGSVNVNFFR